MKYGDIRMSWVCGNMVPYMVFFTIADGKITKVSAMDTVEPIRVMAAPPQAQ